MYRLGQLLHYTTLCLILFISPTAFAASGDNCNTKPPSAEGEQIISEDVCINTRYYPELIEEKVKITFTIDVIADRWFNDATLQVYLTDNITFNQQIIPDESDCVSVDDSQCILGVLDPYDTKTVKFVATIDSCAPDLRLYFLLKMEQYTSTYQYHFQTCVPPQTELTITLESELIQYGIEARDKTGKLIFICAEKVCTESVNQGQKLSLNLRTRKEEYEDEFYDDEFDEEDYEDEFYDNELDAEEYKFNTRILEAKPKEVNWDGTDCKKSLSCEFTPTQDNHEINVRLPEALPSEGYMILIQGSSKENDGLRVPYIKTTDRVYKRVTSTTFLTNNAEDIYYISNNESTSSIKVDAAPSKQAVKDSILEWARDRLQTENKPLFLVMVDHGLRENFTLFNESSGEDFISAQELNTWLTELESTLVERPNIFIIIGTCYSASFISKLSSPNGNRVIVTSSSTDEESYASPDEFDGEPTGEYFIEKLFIQLVDNRNKLIDAFTIAAEEIEEYAEDEVKGKSQTPHLDTNGDGVGSQFFAKNSEDFESDLLGIRIGTPTGMGNNNTINSSQVLRGDNSAQLWLQNPILAQDKEVFVQIIRPDSLPENINSDDGRQTVPDAHVLQLFYNSQEQRFESEYDCFDMVGEYTIYYLTESEYGVVRVGKSTITQQQQNDIECFSLKTPKNGVAVTDSNIIFEWEKHDSQENPNYIFAYAELNTNYSTRAEAYKALLVDDYELLDDSKAKWTDEANQGSLSITEPSVIVYDAKNTLFPSQQGYYWRVFALENGRVIAKSNIHFFRPQGASAPINCDKAGKLPGQHLGGGSPHPDCVCDVNWNDFFLNSGNEIDELSLIPNYDVQFYAKIMADEQFQLSATVNPDQFIRIEGCIKLPIKHFEKSGNLALVVGSVSNHYAVWGKNGLQEINLLAPQTDWLPTVRNNFLFESMTLNEHTAVTLWEGTMREIENWFATKPKGSGGGYYFFFGYAVDEKVVYAPAPTPESGNIIQINVQ